MTLPEVQQVTMYSNPRLRDPDIERPISVFSDDVVLPSEASEGEKKAALLRRAYLKEEVEFRDLDLTGILIEGDTYEEVHFRDCDFSGARITDVKFIDCTFTACTFYGVHIHKCEMSQTKFEGGIFSGSILKESKLDRCVIDKVRFKETEISHCGMPHAVWEGVEFESGQLYEVDACRGSFIRVNFTLSMVHRFSGDFGRWVECRFSACRLNSISLIQSLICSVEGVNSHLKNCNLRSSNLYDFVWSTLISGAVAHLEDCDFSESVLTRCSFRKLNFKGVTFSHTSLTASKFSLIKGSVECSSVEFANSRIIKSLFSDFKVGLLFPRSELIETELRGARIGDKDLSDTVFFGCRFWSEEGREVQLEDAVIRSSTGTVETDCNR